MTFHFFRQTNEGNPQQKMTFKTKAKGTGVTQKWGKSTL